MEENVKTVDVDPKTVKHIQNGFYSLKTEEGFILVFCNNVVSEKKFETHEAATAYVRKKPWPLIFMATRLYANRVNELEKNIK